MRNIEKNVASAANENKKAYCILRKRETTFNNFQAQWCN